MKEKMPPRKPDAFGGVGFDGVAHGSLREAGDRGCRCKSCGAYMHVITDGDTEYRCCPRLCPPQAAPAPIEQ